MSNHPLRTLSARLTRMNLLVSGAVLLIAVAAFFSYDILTFRQNLVRNLAAEAQIIGDNSISAVTFGDQQSANTTLSSLRRSPDILAAVLATDDGNTFASYRANGQHKPLLPDFAASDNDRSWMSGTHVVVAHRIVFHGKSLGVVFISARLSEIGQRARQYAFIAFAILVFCMAAALAISAIARRLIAQPIIGLADTAILVSRNQDYSLRARGMPGSSEIAVLIDAFNTMLKQIQERDTALNAARNDLEQRVEERTAELKAANRELEAFSYTVAHDLRGPLDAISGIAYLMAHTHTNPAEQPMLDQLRTSTTNMGALIDDLLNFARVSTARIESKPVDLTAIARSIAAELHNSDPNRKVDFNIADLPLANTDAGLMHIVLDNLLRNAWKYSSRHPHACIEFGAKQLPGSDQLTYFIRDDGAGFDPARIGELFQPFQRLHIKAEFPGTGIGLATVQRILARHGGRIWAEGAIEKGATFYFTLH